MTQPLLLAASAAFAPTEPFTAHALMATHLGRTPTDDDLNTHGDHIQALMPKVLIEDGNLLRFATEEAHTTASEHLTDDLRRHHLDYYEGRSATWVARPRLPEEETLFESEVAQFRYAFEWAWLFQRDRLMALALAGGNNLAHYRPYRPLVHHWLDVALDMMDMSEDDALDPGQLRALGDVATTVRHVEAAQNFYYRAMELYGESSMAAQAHVFKGLGDVYQLERNLDAARSFYYKALVLYELIPFALGQAKTLKELAPLTQALRDLDEAREYYGRAAALFAEMGYEVEQANSLKQLAKLETQAGNPDTAAEHYNTAYEIYGQIEFWEAQAEVQLARGNIYALADDIMNATECYDDALAIFQKMGERIGQAHTMRALADLSQHHNNPAQAIYYLHQARDLYAKVEDNLAVIQMDALIGAAHLEMNQPEPAVQAIIAAAPLLDALDDFEGAQETLISIQQTVKAMGDDFVTLWETLAGTPLPNLLGGAIRTRDIFPEVLAYAIESRENLREALDQDAFMIVHQLSKLDEDDRANWLAQALAFCDDYDPDNPKTHQHKALLLKESASLPGNDVGKTLHAAIASFDEALNRLGETPQDYALTQNQRVALLRDMAGMAGENRKDLLFLALKGCNLALEKLGDLPLDYAHTQLNRANLLRELAGLKGQARAEWMAEALMAYDEVLVLLPDNPLERATVQTNRASLLQEIAVLPDEDHETCLKNALIAAADAVRLAEQSDSPETARVAARMLGNVRNNIIENYNAKTFDAWWQAAIDIPQPEWG